ncbi:hypothetical protein [Actinoplanes siamensis]|uniref:Uncharacterized protein n=1 Tax=Actinoplanes siamensis TaxID=1223317 RepID=A0A919TJI9_9ACTN|nr:hypothetical protein [Actinoplanes siamensis]GIF04598.1 hypothetical protein Asi03nite_21360 [Actinoplanes siamensis]
MIANAAHYSPVTNPPASSGKAGVFGGRFKTEQAKAKALTSIVSGQGFLMVGLTGFEPATP